MPTLPSGIVSFLFTDIEGSARLALEHVQAWESIRERHFELLHAAIRKHNGQIFKLIGDGSCSAFESPRGALQAAVEAQRDLQAYAWSGTPPRVRMGIHTGEAREKDGDYTGYLTLTRVQRVMSLAQGGQILLSNSTAELIRGELPPTLGLRDLGEHELRDLPRRERLWQPIAQDLQQDFAALPASAAPSNNLPNQLTSFVGREREVHEINRLVRSHRLVTLTGPGGTGKTRLAIEVAGRMLEGWKDGVWLIELAPLSDAALVPTAIAGTLGMQGSQTLELTSEIAAWLGEKHLMLILDNCEHLIEACAVIADELLRHSSQLCVLSTSREPLGVSGEAVFQVPSLNTPDPGQLADLSMDEICGYPAISLFAERARESSMSFALDESNVLAVAKICHELDGIPLALELAAARARSMRVEQIAERLGSLFDLPLTGARTAAPRHRTLRALIDWSHSLLGPDERVLFRRISVFGGGFALEAAENVCTVDGLTRESVPYLLGQLVDKSLLSLENKGDASRYRMLGAIQQYAAEKLADAGETTAMRQRHLEFILQLADQAKAGLFGAEENQWLDRLDSELDNLRGALAYALELESAESLLLLAGSLWWFWWTRPHWHEGLQWLGKAFAKPGATARTIARAKALVGMGYFQWMGGDFQGAAAAYQEAVDIAREARHEALLMEALPWYGFVLCMIGDYELADPLLQEALELSRRREDPLGEGRALMALGQIHMFRGDFQSAGEALEVSARRFRTAGNVNILAFVVRQLGQLSLRGNDLTRAVDLFQESLILNKTLDDRRGIAAALTALGSALVAQGNYARATQLFGAAATIVESFHGQLMPADLIAYESYMAQARRQLGDEQHQQQFALGKATSLEQALELAL